MYNDILSSGNFVKQSAKKVSQREELISNKIIFEGINEDLMNSYFWHINFAYYVGKGYTSFKLEDYHYFTENNQFGQNVRQIKGGSIRAFQENLQQLIQLVKVHMMPLLKEMKQAEFYKKWFDDIVLNDKIVQELKSKGVKDDDSKLKSARNARNEAINNIKDKWVGEVDGGRLWQMNRSSTEQGLDFALLPQLFFGISLDNPLYYMSNSGKSIKEQLDEDVYPVDISLGAKEQVARFMYRFYTWLPTAIRETDVTFKMKLSALKQFYMQLQMYINFMKPLLIEINKKSERLEAGNFYTGFEGENPEFVNLFDYSYTFIKTLGVRNFAKKDRGEHESLNDLEFSPYGLFIDCSKDILNSKFKGKKGFIFNHEGEKYSFLESSSKDISSNKYDELISKWKENPVYVHIDEVKTYPIIEMDFSQKRKNEILNTPQGQSLVPFMSNQIIYKGYCWNIYEVASYREKLKQDNLDLLETFIDEIKQMKDDLLYYVNYLKAGSSQSSSSPESQNKSSHDKKSNDYTEEKDFLLGPFKGIGELFSTLIPDFGVKSDFFKHKKDQEHHDSNDIHHRTNRLCAAEDTWKLYTIHKKTKGFIQY